MRCLRTLGYSREFTQSNSNRSFFLSVYLCPRRKKKKKKRSTVELSFIQKVKFTDSVHPFYLHFFPSSQVSLLTHGIFFFILSIFKSFLSLFYLFKIFFLACYIRKICLLDKWCVETVIEAFILLCMMVVNKKKKKKIPVLISNNTSRVLQQVV